MNRRSFIAATATATTTVVAGCLADGPPGQDPDGATEDPTETPTSTPDPTPNGPELTDSNFEVTGVRCGSDYGHHDVTTGDDSVTVDGVLDGRNTCYTAELVRGEYADDEDTLYVEVEARAGDDGCVGAQCIVEIHYTATFTFDGGTPGRIDVEQRGATSGSSSTSKSASASASDSTTSDSNTTD